MHEVNGGSELKDDDEVQVQLLHRHGAAGASDTSARI